MNSWKRMILLSLAGGVVLSALACLLPWEHCICGNSRGLPMAITHPHEEYQLDFYFGGDPVCYYLNLRGALIDIVFWGAPILAGAWIIRRRRRRYGAPRATGGVA